MNTGLFLLNLEKLLKKFGTITQHEAESSFHLIRQYIREQNQKEEVIIEEGKCLNCTTETRYERKVGIEHLNGLRNIWKTPPKITVGKDFKSKINNRVAHNILPYLCKKCKNECNTIIESSTEYRKEKEYKQEVEERKRIQEIIEGSRKSTPPKRFWLMKERFTEKDYETLKKMKYTDFLKTTYWEIVRNYMLYKMNYQCEVCSRRGVNLNVHHKNYENHGKEHLYLFNLIVLCQECHGKFHEKLPISK